MQSYVSVSKGDIFDKILVGGCWVSSVRHSRDSSPVSCPLLQLSSLAVVFMCTYGYTVKCMSAHADGCVFDVSVVLDPLNTGVTDSHRAPGCEYLLATLY